jgi:aminoglycoside/choline kinase family phosphotransferase
MIDSHSRLEEFLSVNGQPRVVEQLTPDASTREYFRVEWNGEKAIACVYPETFIAAEQSYIDVTNLFRKGGLPAAEIYAFDERLGIILLEDFGDTILRDVLARADENVRDRLINESILLIARIQSITQLAFDLGSIASRLKFDTEKLLWELNFFREHYFTTLKNIALSGNEIQALDSDFLELSKALEVRATVLCHRDFHAANLMVDAKGDLRIIDHQDARIGSVTYDLVSLLLDRVTELPPTDWLKEKRGLLLEYRESIGLPALSKDEFDYEFRLQTVQRCLKAIGTFSFQSANRGKTHFLPYIRPTFETVLRTLSTLDRFPRLAAILEERLDA